jgi:hypothetical protein
MKTAKVEWNGKNERFELVVKGKSLIKSDSRKTLETLAESMGYEVEGENVDLHV